MLEQAVSGMALQHDDPKHNSPANPGPSAVAKNVRFLRQGETIVFTVHGAAYTCTHGEASGWHAIGDGYKPVHVVRCGGNCPFRVAVASDNGEELLSFNIARDTRVRRTKPTFLQWHLKGDRLNYGIQHVNESEAAQFQSVMEKAVSVAREVHFTPITPNTSQRVQQLGRIGQTTDALQVLTDQAITPSGQAKLVMKVWLPGGQSTVTSLLPSITLYELLVQISERRGLDPSRTGVRLAKSGSALFEALALKMTTVGSLGSNEIVLQDLSALVSSQRKQTKADQVRLIATHAPVSQLSTSNEVVFLQVHLPDGAKTLIKVPASMSMGELLYYITQKRGFDITCVQLCEAATGKKSVSMKGNIGQSGLKEVFLVRRRRGRSSSRHRSNSRERQRSSSRDAGVLRDLITDGPLEISKPQLIKQPRASRDATERRTSACANGETASKPQISAPLLQEQSSTSAPSASVSRDEVQLVSSLMAEKVALDDPRLPLPWRQVFERAGLVGVIGDDGVQRAQIVDIVHRHGGPSNLLTEPDDDLVALFKPATVLLKARKPAPRAPPVQPSPEQATCTAGPSTPASCAPQFQGGRRKKAPPPPAARTQAVGGVTMRPTTQRRPPGSTERRSIALLAAEFEKTRHAAESHPPPSASTGSSVSFSGADLQQAQQRPRVGSLDSSSSTKRPSVIQETRSRSGSVSSLGSARSRSNSLTSRLPPPPPPDPPPSSAVKSEPPQQQTQGPPLVNLPAPGSLTRPARKSVSLSPGSSPGKRQGESALSSKRPLVPAVPTYQTEPPASPPKEATSTAISRPWLNRGSSRSLAPPPVIKSPPQATPNATEEASLEEIMVPPPPPPSLQAADSVESMVVPPPPPPSSEPAQLPVRQRLFGSGSPASQQLFVASTPDGSKTRSATAQTPSGGAPVPSQPSDDSIVLPPPPAPPPESPLGSRVDVGVVPLDVPCRTEPLPPTKQTKAPPPAKRPKPKPRSSIASIASSHNGSQPGSFAELGLGSRTSSTSVVQRCSSKPTVAPRPKSIGDAQDFLDSLPPPPSDMPSVAHTDDEQRSSAELLSSLPPPELPLPPPDGLESILPPPAEELPVPVCPPPAEDVALLPPPPPLSATEEPEVLPPAPAAVLQSSPDSVAAAPPCQNCGTELFAGAKFCGECGSLVAPKPSGCASCSRPLANDVKFCPHCGTPTSAADLPPPAPDLCDLPPPAMIDDDEDVLPPPPMELIDPNAGVVKPPTPPPLPSLNASNKPNTFDEIKSPRTLRKVERPSASKARDPRDATLEAIRKGQVKLKAATRIEKPVDVRSELLSAIAKAQHGTLKKVVVEPKAEDPRDTLLSAIRKAKQKQLRKAVPVEKPADERDTLLCQLKSHNPLARLKKAQVEDKPKAPVLDARGALLVSIGALGKDRKASLKKTVTQLKAPKLQRMSSMQRVLGAALDARRSVLDEEEEDNDDWDD